MRRIWTRFFKGREYIIEATRALVEENSEMILMHLTTINSQILDLMKEVQMSERKMTAVQEAVIRKVDAIKGGQDALLSAFADLLKNRPEIKELPEEKKASLYDGLF